MGSKNKVTKEIRAIAGKYSHRAIRSVWKLATHAENLDVQLKALTLILAYAHGKPTDRQELTGADGKALLPQHTDKETARRLALLLTLPDFSAASPASSGNTPPQPARMVTYCTPSTLKVIGEATMPVWAGNDQSFSPFSEL